jgi:hypothetical protein
MSHNATIVQYYIDQIKYNNENNIVKPVKSINNKTNNINFIDIIYNKIKNINKSNDKPKQ